MEGMRPQSEEGKEKRSELEHLSHKELRKICLEREIPLPSNKTKVFFFFFWFVRFFFWSFLKENIINYILEGRKYQRRKGKKDQEKKQEKDDEKDEKKEETKDEKKEETKAEKKQETAAEKVEKKLKQLRAKEEFILLLKIIGKNRLKKFLEKNMIGKWLLTDSITIRILVCILFFFFSSEYAFPNKIFFRLSKWNRR